MSEVASQKEVPEIALKCYNMAQLWLIAYQKAMGFIKDEMEYVEDTAELFHMIADRMVTIRQRIDYASMREELDKITTSTKKRIYEESE